MILQDAYEIAQGLLDSEIRKGQEHEVLICTCDEFSQAWVFGYNTRPFLERMELMASLIGNGPIIVPKSGEDAYLGGTATPIEDQIMERWPDGD